MIPESPASESRSLNFIEEIMEAELASGKHGGRICTRFPRSPTATCTSATPSPSASISAWP